MERELGLLLPPDYVWFLEDFGWGGVSHWELAGIGPGVPRHLLLLEMARSEWEREWVPVPRSLLPTMQNGAGDQYCLDTSEPDADGLMRVVGWWHEEDDDQPADIWAPSFADFLHDLLFEAS